MTSSKNVTMDRIYKNILELIDTETKNNIAFTYIKPNLIQVWEPNDYFGMNEKKYNYIVILISTSDKDETHFSVQGCHRINTSDYDWDYVPLQEKFKLEINTDNIKQLINKIKIQFSC